MISRYVKDFQGMFKVQLARGGKIRETFCDFGSRNMMLLVGKIERVIFSDEAREDLIRICDEKIFLAACTTPVP